MNVFLYGKKNGSALRRNKGVAFNSYKLPYRCWTIRDTSDVWCCFPFPRFLLFI